jgi:DNA-binding MarR family transcriptional regulator
LALGILADAGSPLPPNQIAERLIISRATVTGLLDSLEKRGYVRRLPHSSDRRMLLIELTDAGRRVAHEFRLLVHQHQKAWLAALNEQEQKHLIASLHRLQSALADSKS